MNRRILFVDDAQKVLQSLPEVLDSMRAEWDMEFDGGGQEALAVLSKAPFDAVVSDLRMPGIGGVEFLNQVMKRYPHVVQIILSEQPDREMVMKSVVPTHQCIRS